MAYETIKYEVKDNILTITLNRPDKLNAFTGEMMQELIDAFDRADADDDVRAIVVTGEGRAFCAGADLSDGAKTFDYAEREDRPDKAGDFQFDASLVHIAIAMSNGELNGLSMDEIASTIYPSVWALTGLDQEDLEQLIEEIPNKAAEIMDIILSPSERLHSSSGHCPD